VRDDLRLRKIKQVLGSTVAPSDVELRNAYSEAAQKTEAWVIRLKLDDFLATTQVPDEDLKKTYEERKAALKTDEMRKVKYVSFILPTTATPLQGKDRAEALAKFQKQAEEFAIAMTDKDAKFEDVAAKFGVKVEETPEFSRGAPPALLGESMEAAAATFKLTKEQPNADPIGTNRGYYVVQLSGITAPRPLTFDEAKTTLVDELKRDRAAEALNLKATEIRRPQGQQVVCRRGDRGRRQGGEVSRFFASGAADGTGQFRRDHVRGERVERGAIEHSDADGQRKRDRVCRKTAAHRRGEVQDRQGAHGGEPHRVSKAGALHGVDQGAPERGEPRDAPPELAARRSPDAVLLPRRCGRGRDLQVVRACAVS
jgi:hypothetical protein